MKSILICVPTMNRAHMVKEVLEYEIEYYRENDIQLCYYDSSDTQATERIINDISLRYGATIGYQRLDSTLCLDNKLVEILRDLMSKEFDYLWLINDATSIKKGMLEYVKKLAEGNYDLIRLPLSGEGRKEDYICTDINKWFQECSQSMAHMASTVMNRSLLEVQPDFEYLRDRYICNNELNINHGFFFMVAFFLEQIARLTSFKGIFVGNNIKWRRESRLKKGKSYWQKYVFETWAKSYPETILKLPDCYKNKEEVIRKSDNIMVGRFSKEMLVHYRLNGLYDIDVYNLYKKWFKYITDESAEICRDIALTPVTVLAQRYPNLKVIESNWEDFFDKIEMQLANQKIYIYGAGFYGENVLQKLMQSREKKNIKGVIVTSLRGNVNELCGVKVVELNSVVRKLCDAVVVIAALPATANKMEQELKKYNIKRYIKLFGDGGI